MLQVQKELQALKARANDAEMQLKRNDKLKTLEEEKEWYRKEVSVDHDIVGLEYWSVASTGDIFQSFETRRMMAPWLCGG